MARRDHQRHWGVERARRQDASCLTFSTPPPRPPPLSWWPRLAGLSAIWNVVRAGRGALLPRRRGAVRLCGLCGMLPRVDVCVCLCVCVLVCLCGAVCGARVRSSLVSARMWRFVCGPSCGGHSAVSNQRRIALYVGARFGTCLSCPPGMTRRVQLHGSAPREGANRKGAIARPPGFLPAPCGGHGPRKGRIALCLVHL